MTPQEALANQNELENTTHHTEIKVLFFPFRLYGIYLFLKKKKT